MKILWIAILIAPLALAQAQQQGRPATPQDLNKQQVPPAEPVRQERLVSGRVQLEGAIVKSAPDRVTLRPTAATQAAPAEMTVVLSPAALGDLKPGTYSVLADQRSHSGGIAGALKLRDQRGLAYLSEKIIDVPLLKPADREGWIVTQQPAGRRTFVFEDQCKAVYNVPTEFRFGDQKWELSAHQTQVVRVANATYKLSLNQSQFVVLKECRITFEGGRSEVDYTISRS